MGQSFVSSLMENVYSWNRPASAAADLAALPPSVAPGGIPTDSCIETSTMAQARAVAAIFGIATKASWKRRELLDAVKAGLAPLRAAASAAPAAPAADPAPFVYNWAAGALPLAERDCPPVPAPRACFAKVGPQLPAFVTQQQQQQQPQQAPAAAPLQTGPKARTTAPLGMPEDAARLLQRFDLSVDGLLTAGSSSPKLSKGAAIAQAVILHHLPARSLGAAVYGDDDARTAPRSKLPGLAELAARNGIASLISRHNGCPWASKGCSAGCLAWAGHGGISTTVAAARARRTMAFVWGHSVYALAVLWAIGRAYAAAQRKGQGLAYRLRGTDDLPWHDLRFNLSPAEAARFARRFGLPAVPGIGTTIPEVLSLAAPGTLHPYEYSAAPLQGPLGLLAQRAAGIDVTCSLKADRPGGCAAAADAIAAGFRVAVPVAIAKGQPLPTVLWLKPSDAPALRLLVVDGDVHDHRWMDPQGPQPGGFQGVAVLLRTKISRGRGAAAAAFSLAPTVDQWQPLAGGGQAQLSQF